MEHEERGTAAAAVEAWRAGRLGRDEALLAEVELRPTVAAALLWAVMNQDACMPEDDTALAAAGLADERVAAWFAELNLSPAERRVMTAPTTAARPGRRVLWPLLGVAAAAAVAFLVLREPTKPDGPDTAMVKGKLGEEAGKSVLLLGGEKRPCYPSAPEEDFCTADSTAPIDLMIRDVDVLRARFIAVVARQGDQARLLRPAALPGDLPCTNGHCLLMRTTLPSGRHELRLLFAPGPLPAEAILKQEANPPGIEVVRFFIEVRT